MLEASRELVRAYQILDEPRGHGVNSAIRVSDLSNSQLAGMLSSVKASVSRADRYYTVLGAVAKVWSASPIKSYYPRVYEVINEEWPSISRHSRE